MDIFDQIIEATTSQLLRKQKSITRLFPTFPDRVKAVADKGGIRLNGVEDTLWKFKIHSGTKKSVWYDATISFGNVVGTLANIVRDRRLWVKDKSRIDRSKLARKFMNKASIRLSCSCPADLYYGGQYIRSLGKYDAKHGDQETRPPKERNPKQYGAFCKHLQNLMKVLPFYTDTMAKWLNDFYDDTIKEIEQDVRKEYGGFKKAAGELKKKKDTEPGDKKHKDRHQKDTGRKDRHRKDKDSDDVDRDRKDKKDKDTKRKHPDRKDRKDKEPDKDKKEDEKDKDDKGKKKKQRFDAPYESVKEVVKTASVIKILLGKYGKDVGKMVKSGHPEDPGYKFFLLPDGKIIPVAYEHQKTAEAAGLDVVDIREAAIIDGYISNSGELDVMSEHKITRRQIITLVGMLIPYHITRVYSDIEGKSTRTFVKSSKELDYFLTYGTLDESVSEEEQE